MPPKPAAKAPTTKKSELHSNYVEQVVNKDANVLIEIRAVDSVVMNLEWGLKKSGFYVQLMADWIDTIVTEVIYSSYPFLILKIYWSAIHGGWPHSVDESRVYS